MRWLGPVVDREDDFTPFLTSHLPVRVTVLRRVSLALVLVGFGVALGVVLHRSEQVQLAGTTALEAFVYLLLVDLPTRRLHVHSRVGVDYALLHLLTTVALIGWTWLLPLSDSAANGHGAPVLAGLLGDPHPDATGAYRTVAWALGLLAVSGGVSLHVLIQRLGQTLSSRPRTDPSR